MTASDQNRQDWLDREWDTLVRGDEVGINPEYAALLRSLQRDDPIPGPAPEFVQSLWAELESGSRRPDVRNIWNGQHMALVAAAVALLLVSAGLLAVLVNDDTAPDDGLGAVTEPTATVVIETPDAASSPTATSQQTAPVAIASPTASEAPQTPATVATATIDPNATVPVMPTPPRQGGGVPAYTSLADYVNNADLIVIGTVSGPAKSDEQGLQYRPLVVDRMVRGDALDELLAYGMSDSDITVEQYLFFLRGPNQAGVGIFYSIDFFVPLADGAVVPLDDETVEYHPRVDHGGQPVEALIDEIDALPAVEDGIHALLDEYGWTPIRKGYLWPQTLPERDAFGQSGPMPRRTPFWDELLAASARTGLDFSEFAGQTVQVLPVIVERDMADRQRMLLVELVVVEQRVVGAWVVVLPDPQGRAYGLDEREAVLAIPVHIPTPEPTPTVAIPSGATVNPARFYRLAETETFMLCWPYCSTEPVTVAFRDAVAAALEQELKIQSAQTHPIPERPNMPEPATGEYVIITFGYLTPGWPRLEFVYDRVAGLVLLPNEAGWVEATIELATLLDGIEAPPLPTKPV